MKARRKYTCSCGKPMTPYAENLRGSTWLETCTGGCSTYRLSTWEGSQRISEKNAQGIAERWKKINKGVTE